MLHRLVVIPARSQPLSSFPRAKEESSASCGTATMKFVFFVNTFSHIVLVSSSNTSCTSFSSRLQAPRPRPRLLPEGRVHPGTVRKAEKGGREIGRGDGGVPEGVPGFKKYKIKVFLHICFIAARGGLPVFPVQDAEQAVLPAGGQGGGIPRPKAPQRAQILLG